jgi:hypothetical protein
VYESDAGRSVTFSRETASLGLDEQQNFLIPSNIQDYPESPGGFGNIFQRRSCECEVQKTIRVFSERLCCATED